MWLFLFKKHATFSNFLHLINNVRSTKKRFYMRTNLLFFACNLLAIILVSCGPPHFERDERILVKGKIVNQDNEGLTNNRVSVYTEILDFGIYFSPQTGDTYLLGQNFSQENGEFSVVSLFDRDSDFYVLVEGQEMYSSYVYKTDTSNRSKNNLTFNLGTVELRRLANVNFNFTRTSGIGNELTYTVIFTSPNCFEVYENNVLDDDASQCFQPFYLSQNLGDSFPDSNESVTTILGSTVTFIYSINGQPEVTESIIVDNEDFTYDFSY